MCAFSVRVPPAPTSDAIVPSDALVIVPAADTSADEYAAPLLVSSIVP